MSSARDIKQRIGNIRSVEQTIKAMDMLASTQLVKCRAQLEGIRPIYRELKRISQELGQVSEARTHIFYRDREVKSSLYVILTSDKGLSGSYNAKITAKALEHMNQGKNEQVLVVGAKGNEFFKRKKKNIVRSITDVKNANIYYGTESIAKWLLDSYLSGEAEEVFVAYTRFENVLTYTPVVEKMLPLSPGVAAGKKLSEKTYEPDFETFVDHAIPLYFHMKLFRAFSESHTSEQASRMVNMDAAGKNASDLIEDLTRIYNRKRQASITQELSEIVGSANILNKGGLNGI